MADRDDMLRKIGALLAKAEGTDNEHEADAFLTKAQELMLRHAISEQAARSAHGAARSDDPTHQEIMYSPDGKNAVGKAALMGHVARACHVQFYPYARNSWNLRRAGGIHARWGVLIGFPSDIEAAKAMFASLLVQGMHFGTLDWTDARLLVPGGKSAFLTAYLLGYGKRVGQRLRDLETKIVDATPHAGALITARDAEVDALRQRLFVLDSHTNTYTGSGIGMAMGALAGDRADLGQTRIGTSSRMLGTGRKEK